MNIQLQSVLESLKKNAIQFDQVITLINTHYQHHSTAFKNGDTYNEATQNQGSARVFAFAKLNNLSTEDTLSLFAEHYQTVLATPDAADHQNIRQFMIHGWPGIAFEGEPLVAK
jgi:hypothetical protein